MNTLYNNNVDGALKLITVNGHTYQLGKDASASEGGISKLYGSFETYKAATDGGRTPRSKQFTLGINVGF